MYIMIRSGLVLALLVLVGGCDDGAEATLPEEQELARVNRELAALKQTVEALHARVDGLEAARHGIEVRGKGAATPQAPLVVALDGKRASGLGFVVDGKALGADDLKTALAGAQGRVESAGVELVAPPETPQAWVVEALDTLRSLGVERVALRTRASDGPEASSDGATGARP